MQKCMIQMNIQLHKVISDITGFTGMRIIRSILYGERDPLKLAQLKSTRIRNSADVIAKSLKGNYREEQLFCLRQEVEQCEYIKGKILECEKIIEKTLSEMDGGKDDDSDDKNDNAHKENIKSKLRFCCMGNCYQLICLIKQSLLSKHYADFEI